MQDYRLSDSALLLWLNYIEHQVGFVLPKSQHNWVKGIIERHMAHKQLDSTELLQLIVHEATLYHQLMDEILIPSTQFFRHVPTFSFVEDFASLWSVQQQNHANPFTSWSVGCSSGQEAVSIALCLEQALHDLQDFQVFGSDFNQKALAQATVGQYSNLEKKLIPVAYQPYLAEQQDEKFSLMPNLKSKLQFFSHNLVDSQPVIPLRLGQCQLIVCKNVLIYFRQFEQRDIIRLLTQYLADDGILLLGAGQILTFDVSDLQKIELSSINGYVKKSAPSWLTKLANIDGNL